MGSSVPRDFVSVPKYGYAFAESEYPASVVKNEPMFFNASLEYANQHGGPITQAFISALADKWMTGVFDSRVHMLMPGWFPAIPGWHHDDVPRPKIPTGQHFITAGQPDYDNQRYKARHIMGLAGGAICPTQFAVGVARMKAVPDGGLIYRQWHGEIEQQIAEGSLKVEECPSLTLVEFDWQVFHQAQRAVSNGWRWFGRVTINSERTKEITNEIRRQVQVYLEFPMEGW